MKTLTLIRHAKSSWDDDKQDDAERPLAKRGHRDLLVMGPNLRGLSEAWGTVFVSRAQRARETFAGLAEQGVFGGIEATVSADCYTFDADVLAGWLRACDDASDAITVIGHNPAMHELVNTWYDPGIPRVPTLCVVRLLSDAARWQDFTAGEVRLGAYFYPAMFRS